MQGLAGSQPAFMSGMEAVGSEPLQSASMSLSWER